MQIDKQEFLRYLGWKGQETDADFQEKLDEAAKHCLELCDARSVVRRFSLTENFILGGTDFCLEGNDIRAHLAGCREIYLFAATIGAGAERERFWAVHTLPLGISFLLLSATLSILLIVCSTVAQLMLR